MKSAVLDGGISGEALREAKRGINDAVQRLLTPV